MKKAVVTGASGFVGTAVCRALATYGYEVIAVVRNNKSSVSGLQDYPNIRIEYCDLSEISCLPTILSDRDIDIFYHFAWTGSAGPLRGDIDCQLQNVKAACDAVKACHEVGCHKFVFAASIMEYEIDAIMQEEVTPDINSLYSSAKLAADYMARTVCGKYKIEYIRAVISNVYGPGEHSQRLIINSLKKLLCNEHCSFSSGEQLYDFIYISDAADAFVALGESAKPNKTYYIGSHDPRPLKSFLLEMRDCVQQDIKLGLGDLPFNGVTLSYREFDLYAVQKDTGFVPRVSFPDGIKKTIEWLNEEEVSP